MPPKNRDRLLHFRVTEDELNYIKKRAYEKGMRLSDYVRSQMFMGHHTVPHATAVEYSPAKSVGKPPRVAADLDDNEITSVPVYDQGS